MACVNIVIATERKEMYEMFAIQIIAEILIVMLVAYCIWNENELVEVEQTLLKLLRSVKK